jgi:hypothetical protein
MDEARPVLRRLRRIEALEREGAPARRVLAEVHALVEEAQAWVSAERAAAEGPGSVEARAEEARADLAEAAVARCRDALAAGARGGRLVRGKEAAMR